METHFLWAQITLLVLSFVGLLIAAGRHGKKQNATHNFWSDLLSTLVSFFLMFMAGAFSLIF